MQSPLEEVERAAIFEGYDRHLETPGLFVLEVPSSTIRGEAPKFDRHGRIKHSSLRISPLGRALLRAIDQPAELDRAHKEN